MIAKSIELTIGQLRDGDGGDNDDGYDDRWWAKNNDMGTPSIVRRHDSIFI